VDRVPLVVEWVKVTPPPSTTRWSPFARMVLSDDEVMLTR